MARKLWIAFVTCALILWAPLGGVAAQVQAPTPNVNLLASRTSAMRSRPAGKLSYRLQLLADSAELMMASNQAQAQALGLPASGPGSLMKDDQGRILVDIGLVSLTDANLAGVRSAGAQIVHVSPQYRVATALVAASRLAALGQLGAVSYAMEEYTPLVGSGALAASPSNATPAGLRAPASVCPVGTAVSEGDVQLKADQARTTYSVNGSGVQVGILSDSYDADATAVTHAAADVATGDLPGTTNTCGFTTLVHVISETLSTGTATDEGRAMLQIVHDLAPGATLGFASAHNGLFAFADNIRALRSWGANVIADDVSYFVEPMFQEGPVSVAISDVTASGAVYLTSAANSNVIVAGHNIASYEAPSYRPMAVPGFLSGQGEQSCHDFNPGAGTDNTYGITLQNNGSVLLIMQWAEPWYAVTTELDLYVTDSNNVLTTTPSIFLGPSAAPFQFVSWSNTTGSTQTYNVEVCQFTGSGFDSARPRFKWIMLQSRGVLGVEYPTSTNGDIVGPTIFGHSASLFSLSVAAARFSDNNNPETFSSRGPATHLFGPVVGVTPAGAISPVVINQPDFTATDGGCTTFFAQFDAGTPCWRFFGTSAAAPHAAGVVALLKQKANLTGAVGINQSTAKFLLQSTASAMSGGTATSVGAGLINALAAIAKELLFTHHLFLPNLQG